MKSPLIEIEGVEQVALEIRAHNGQECLFTSDGKLISNQVAGMCFPWIIKHNHKDSRTFERTFRVTIKIDDEAVRYGAPI